MGPDTDKKLIRATFDPEPPYNQHQYIIGDIEFYMNTMLSGPSHAVEDVVIKSAIVGDPTLELWTDAPQEFNVTIDFDNDIVYVKDTSNNPIQGAIVTFIESGFYRVRETNISGIADPNHDIIAITDINVTRHNFIPYQRTQTIYENTTFSGTVNIDGILKVAEGVTITLDNCTFNIDDNSSLYINSGSTFIFDNSELYTGNSTFINLQNDAQITDTHWTNSLNIGMNSQLNLEGEYSMISLDNGDINIDDYSVLNMLGEGAKVKCFDLNLGWGCEVVGAYKTVDNSNPEKSKSGGGNVDGNRIECNNIICNGYCGGDHTIEFKAINDYTSWDGIYVDLLGINYRAWFKYCKFSGLENIVITGTGEEYDDDRIVFDNCEYFNNNGPVIIDNICAGYAGSDYTLPIKIECTDFHDNYSGLALYRILQAHISGNVNFYNNNYGLIIGYPPYDISMHYVYIYANIYDNLIGVTVYENPLGGGPNVNLHSTIENNIFGLYLGYQGYVGYGTFINNLGPEIKIFTNRGYYYYPLNDATITDDVYEPDNFDQWLVYCNRYDENFNPINLSYVNWGSSPIDRLYPSDDAYLFEWIGDGSLADSLYNNASESIEEEDYQNAESIFKYIIDNYNDSNPSVSIASFNKLKTINKYLYPDYNSFRTYVNSIYSNNDIFNAEKELSIASSYLYENQFEEAINIYESVINNPATEIDSITAIINEGFCYLKCLQDSGKATVEECTFKPKNFNDYLSTIYEMYLDDSFFDYEPIYIEKNVKDLFLCQNYPNPVRSSTTISFSITKDAKNSEMKIYNIKGQLVKQFSIINEQSSIKWDGKDSNGNKLWDGIYLYKLDTGEKQ